MQPSSTPRLVALDLDGTVVAPGGIVSERVLRAIAQAREAGIATSIVTGRMYHSAQPFLARLGIDAPLVCYQGAGIYDAVSGNVLRHIPLPTTVTTEILDYARRTQCHVQLYAEGTSFVEQRNAYADIYAAVSGIAPTVVDSLASAFADQVSTKAVLVAEPERAMRIAEELRLLCGDRAYVTRSNPEFVEILAPRVDKGDALRFVAEYLHIPLHETMSVGDSWNDVPLLEAAGFGVAMGSAPQELRAVADAIVADVHHDGVAEAYDRFVLSRPLETA